MGKMNFSTLLFFEWQQVFWQLVFVDVSLYSFCSSFVLNEAATGLSNVAVQE